MLRTPTVGAWISRLLAASACAAAIALSACGGPAGEKPQAAGSDQALFHGALPAATAAKASGPVPDVISFNRDVRPILSDNCFACHGPDKAGRKADLSLQTKEEAIRALASGVQAIVPGDHGKSALFQRITHPDLKERMPPVSTEKTLSEREIEILKRWIDAGAEYQPHWAYIPPERPAVPKVDGAKTPIDAFILAKLAEEGLSPAPEADKRTLIRRASLDLTGLPPTPERVAAFVADTRPDAYERLIDELLASPHYGERMAVDWLDAVRYADTWGYHADQNRQVWPYRDYVIRAFNENKSFDRFTIEQIAGDLIPGASPEQRVASTYNMMVKITGEGGAQVKEYLARYMSDRVTNIGTAWLAQTTGCAECHDHKYDPIRAKDFYAMQAYFADIKEVGRWSDPWHGIDAERQFPIFYVGDQRQMSELSRLRAYLEAA
jgi:mono/diheme cytochrome c family protein